MQKNYYLAIDTVNLNTSAAVLDDEGILAYEINLKPSQQAKTIFSLIEQVLEKAGISYDMLTKVIVSIGPGSFTGIRIGLSAAQGIAIGKNIEVVGIDNFSAFLADKNITENCLIRIDGGKSDFYEVEIIDGKIASEGKLVNQTLETSLPVYNVGYTDVTALSVAKAFLASKNGNIKLSPPSPYYIRPANITQPKAQQC
ncbi:MAG: tRNA (adenosine(37)-N6)-threonylcarbamoyltransferase complex dimerization subunit type 1 TsaB [Alphaproteobacteria bacterium]|nr:tRNA (adenosine(37)-N6)-threonylcarbamoyltransferase complex dimerization subunit type 1 TsaB [Alphaproteobacteria bacterium]OJV16096.1 MAG: tRNA (adenosine(37)-N6)-threonylcarbamoyltransferase complex dimerization subunit type 1 TsaB [Alphaproteobacteria bacterium 33-17]